MEKTNEAMKAANEQQQSEVEALKAAKESELKEARHSPALPVLDQAQGHCDGTKGSELQEPWHRVADRTWLR